MRLLMLAALVALAPLPAVAQCAPGAEVVQTVAFKVVATMTVQERNEATMKAALGGDDSHATDADLD